MTLQVPHATTRLVSSITRWGDVSWDGQRPSFSWLEDAMQSSDMASITQQADMRRNPAKSIPNQACPAQSRWGKEVCPISQPQERDRAAKRFPLALALCQRRRGFQCHESTRSGGYFRAGSGGAEAAQGWEEVGDPRGKGEAPSLETLLFLLAQLRAGNRVRRKADWGLDTELPGAMSQPLLKCPRALGFASD